MRFIAFLLFLVVIILGPVVAYGYYDAYSTQVADISVRVAPKSWYSVNYDTIDFPQNTVDHGRVFLLIDYYAPIGKTIASVKMSGSVWQGSRKLEDFDEQCKQGSSTRLGADAQYKGLYGATQCFIKLKSSVMNGKADQTIKEYQAELIRMQVEQLQLKDLRSTVKVKNNPMRFIVWINDALTLLRAPFERS